MKPTTTNALRKLTEAQINEMQEGIYFLSEEEVNDVSGGNWFLTAIEGASLLYHIASFFYGHPEYLESTTGAFTSPLNGGNLGA